jgi:hypothetical protein
MTPSTQVTLRALGGEPDEMLALQRVIEDAPRYAHLITGVPPGPADAQSLYTILPEGKSYATSSSSASTTAPRWSAAPT